MLFMSSTIKAMGKEAKPVLLKQNILVKNRNHHPELSEKDSRETLQKALYENDLVGQSQPSKRPNYWVAVQLSSGKNAVAVLDITETKTHHEIVGWRIINDKSLQALKNQAVREGGQILTSQDDNLRASSDHTEPGNLSNTVTPEAEKSSEAAGKVEEKAEAKAEPEAKVAEKAEMPKVEESATEPEAENETVRLINQFKAELEGKELDAEQQGVYDVMTRQKDKTIIRVQDLDTLKEYVLLKGSRGKGAHKILTVHYAGKRGKVTADEIINIGTVIRNGQYFEGDEKHPTSHTYEMTAEDGARLRVVIDYDKQKNESVINFYSNRKAEDRAHQASSGKTTDSGDTVTPEAEKSSEAAGKVEEKAEAKAEPESKVAEKAEMPKAEKTATAKTPEIVKINTVSEITDEDFQKPYRSLELPSLPERTLKAMGKEAKPVLLKQNILVKNRNHHPELSEKDSRTILQKALYESDTFICDKPSTKPNYWVLVEVNGKNSLLTIEISETKTHHEIVGWRFASEKSVNQIKNRAEREGGQVLVTESNAQGASGLHALPSNSGDTVTPEAEKSSEAAGKVEEKAEEKDGQPKVEEQKPEEKPEAQPQKEENKVQVDRKFGKIWEKDGKRRLYLNEEDLERLGIDGKLEKFSPYVDLKEGTFVAKNRSRFTVEEVDRIRESARQRMKLEEEGIQADELKDIHSIQELIDNGEGFPVELESGKTGTGEFGKVWEKDGQKHAYVYVRENGSSVRKKGRTKVSFSEDGKYSADPSGSHADVVKKGLDRILNAETAEEKPAAVNETQYDGYQLSELGGYITLTPYNKVGGRIPVGDANGKISGSNAQEVLDIIHSRKLEDAVGQSIISRLQYLAEKAAEERKAVEKPENDATVKEQEQPKEKNDFIGEHVFGIPADAVRGKLGGTETKTHHEIVGWRIINDKSLQALKNQAVREGGQILTSQDDNLRASSDHTEPGNLSNTVTPEAEKSSEAVAKVDEKAESGKREKAAPPRRRAAVEENGEALDNAGRVQLLSSKPAGVNFKDAKVYLDRGSGYSRVRLAEKGNDLYALFTGQNFKNRYIKIADYQNTTPAEVIADIPNQGRNFEEALHDYYDAKGLNLGYVAPLNRMKMPASQSEAPAVKSAEQKFNEAKTFPARCHELIDLNDGSYTINGISFVKDGTLYQVDGLTEKVNARLLTQILGKAKKPAESVVKQNLTTAEEVAALEEKIHQQEQKMEKLAKYATPASYDARKAEEYYKEKSELDKLRQQYNEMLDAAAAKRPESRPERRRFINDFGEATTREITTATYERAQKRQEQAVLRNMGVKFSLKREPLDVEDFRQMEAHERPEKVHFDSVKDLYHIYEQEYLGQTIRAVSGHNLTFKPGHFFRLIAGTPEGMRKGWIAKAKDTADAIAKIKAGKIDFSDIAGYQDFRAKNIKLFRDVVTNADFWYEENGKITYGKKYAGIKKADGFISVTLDLGNNELGILSFYPHRFTQSFLEGKKIHWHTAQPIERAIASDDVSSMAKSPEFEHTVIENPDNSSAESQKNVNFPENDGNVKLSKPAAEEDAEYFAALKEAEGEELAKKLKEAGSEEEREKIFSEWQDEYEGYYEQEQIVNLVVEKAKENGYQYFHRGKDPRSSYSIVQFADRDPGEGYGKTMYAIHRDHLLEIPDEMVDFAHEWAKETYGDDSDVNLHPDSIVDSAESWDDERLVEVMLYKFSDRIDEMHKQGYYGWTTPDGAVVYPDKSVDVKLATAVTWDENGDVIPLSKRFNRKSDSIKLSKPAGDRWHQELERVASQFNQELEQQIEGKLKDGHIYQLGKPSSILRSTGVPDLFMELSARHLAKKAKARHHEFNLSDVRDLPKALANPIGVFAYGDKNKAQNIIVEIRKNGKNFIVGLSLNYQHDGLTVNSIRGLFPKDTREWLTWIQNGKSLYLDKEKIQTMIDQQQTNLADVEYLDLDSIDNIIRNFENPSLKSQKSGKFQENDGGTIKFSIRREEPPKKTRTGYKVFAMFKSHPGELFPPMVANPGGASTPVGVWLNADAAPRAEDSKTGRPRVQSGGKGTNAGKATLAYRPGWHLGPLPEASQFLVKNPETGEAKSMFPENFVFAECEFAADEDYQQEAMSYGYNASGKFQHSLAGLPKVPKDGYYVYRTNPDPKTVPWYISGAMRVKRLLNDRETAEILRENGSRMVPRRGGELDLKAWGFDRTDFSDDGNVKLSKPAAEEDAEYFAALKEAEGEELAKKLKEAGSEEEREKIFSEWQDEYEGYYEQEQIVNLVVEKAKENGYQYFHRGKDPRSSYSIVQFADRDPGEGYGKTMYAIHRDHLLEIPDEMVDFAHEWAKEAYGDDSDVDLHPSSIVDSAESWDDERLVEVMLNKFSGRIDEMHEQGYYGWVTPDGAVVYPDESVEVKLATAVTWDENGDIIPLSKRFNRNSDSIKLSKPSAKLSEMTDEAKGFVRSLFTNGGHSKPDVNPWAKTFGTIFHYARQVPSLERMFDAAANLAENKTKLLKQLFNGETGRDIPGELRALEAKQPEEYRKLNDYMLKQDRNRAGGFVHENGTDEMFVACDLEGNAVDWFDSEEAAWERVFAEERKDVVAEGIMGETAAELLYQVRNAFNRSYMELRGKAESYRKRCDEYGMDYPMIGEGKDAVSVFEAMKKIGDLRGSYFPRVRHGDYLLFAHKEGENPRLEAFTNKAARAVRELALKRQGYEVRLEKSSRPSDEVYTDVSIAGMNDLLNRALNSMTERGITFEELDLDVKRNGYKLKNGEEGEELVISGHITPSMKNVLKQFGGQFYNGAWHFKGMDQYTEKAFRKALAFQKGIQIREAGTFGKAIAEQLAMLLHMRGASSHKIARSDATGKDVYLGYEEDLRQAFGVSVASIAGSSAKSQAAQEMMEAFTGTDMSYLEWLDATYPDEKEPGDIPGLEKPESEKEHAQKGIFRIPKGKTYAGLCMEYMDFCEDRRIDSGKQPNAYKSGMDFYKDMMRNNSNLEDALGKYKGWMSVYFLSRASSGLVNMTTMLTHVPAMMSAYGKTTIPHAMKLVAQESGKYLQYLRWNKFGKGHALNSSDAWVYDKIHEFGWDNSQMEREVAGTVLTWGGKLERFITEKALWVFSSTERFNRNVTIAAGYRGLLEAERKATGKEISEERKIELLRQAKKDISDRSHGVYGKLNLPDVIRGDSPLAVGGRMYYDYKTYTHNTIQDMVELGMRGRKKELAWMLLAPAVIGGAKASVLLTLANLIWSALGGDPEKDVEQWWYETAHKLGGDPGERFARMGAAGTLGLDLRGSMSMAGIAELPKTTEELLGAPYAFGKGILTGAGLLAKGRYAEGVEKILPAALSAPVKAVREQAEGVTDKKGRPVKYEDKQIVPDVLDTLSRSLGFNPAGISEKREKLWSEKKAAAYYRERRAEIYAHAREWSKTPLRKRSEWAKVMREVEEYNAKVKRSGRKGIAEITDEGLRRAMR